MIDRTLIAAIIAAFVFTSCADPSVFLAYRFDDGAVHDYIYAIHTTSRVTSAGREDVSSSTLEVNVRERVADSSGPGARLLVRLDPTETIDGRSFRLPDRTVEVRVSRSGAVSFSGRAGQPDLAQVIAEVRPPLPRGPAKIGDTWDADQQFELEEVSLSLEGTGKLTGFVVKDGRRLAKIRVVRSGPITADMQIGRSSVKLTGTIQAVTQAEIDVDRGQLVFSETESLSSFRLTSGSATGRVVVEIDATARLADQGS